MLNQMVDNTMVQQCKKNEDNNYHLVIHTYLLIIYLLKLIELSGLLLELLLEKLQMSLILN
jgi:hypothetical protein